MRCVESKTNKMFQSAGHRTAHEMRLKSEAADAVDGQFKVSEDIPEQVRVMRDTLQIAFKRNVRRER